MSFISKLPVTVLFFSMLTAQDLNLKDHIIYVHPLPNSHFNSTAATLIIRLDNAMARQFLEFQVTGSQSGAHVGERILSTDGKTVIFETADPFTPNEQIDVKLVHRTPNTGALHRYEYSFYISKSNPVQKNVLCKTSIKSAKKINALLGNDIRVVNGVSLPSDFPEINITVDDDPSPGAIFTSTWNDFPYIMILDSIGRPIFYKQMQDRAYDFKVQPTGVLTHYVRKDVRAFVVMDSTYAVIDTLRCKKYGTDEHELRILPNGHILMLAADLKTCDLSDAVPGGNPNATLRGNHIQEFDSERNLIFEWLCWDYFEPADAEHMDLSWEYIDFTHCNALDVDVDGNLLLSTRSLSEITKIDRQTGDIIWRFGGKHNQFDFVDDPYGFSYQHSIRATANGNYLLFDNGNFHRPHFSRAVEYKLDPEEKTAELVWQYRHSPDYYSPYLGNVQRLDNGNTLINYAYYGSPKLLEIRPDGSKAFELDLSKDAATYRTFRLPWDGCAAVPYLVGESHSNCVALIYNKFGDTSVHQYNIYADTQPDPKTVLTSTSKPYMLLTSLENYQRYYFRVTAVSDIGKESDFSNEVVVDVEYSDPHENIVLNGDFSQQDAFWSVQSRNGASASLSIDSSECRVNIQNPGSDYDDVKLVQETLDLVHSARYEIAFNAYSTTDRLIEVNVEKIFEPWTNYSRIGNVYITPQPKRFAYEFVMEHPSDYRAKLTFDCGFNKAPLTISDIVLRCIENENGHNKKSDEPTNFVFYGNSPNPFNLSTTFHFELPEASRVSLTIYDIRGRLVHRALDRLCYAGGHEVFWYGTNDTGSNVTTGVYIYRLEMVPSNGEKQVLTGKMCLVR